MADLSPLTQRWLRQLQAPTSAAGETIIADEIHELFAHVFDDRDAVTLDEYVAARELLVYCAQRESTAPSSTKDKESAIAWRTMFDEYHATAPARTYIEGMLAHMHAEPFLGRPTENGFILKNARYTIYLELHDARHIDPWSGGLLSGTSLIANNGIEYTLIPFEEGRLIRFGQEVYPAIAEALRLATKDFGNVLGYIPGRAYLEDQYGTSCPRAGADEALAWALLNTIRAFRGPMTEDRIRLDLAHTSCDVRQDAVSYLSTLSTTEAVPFLSEIVQNEAKKYPKAARIAAAKRLPATTLRYVGRYIGRVISEQQQRDESKQILDALLGMAGESDQELSQAALSALGTLQYYDAIVPLAHLFVDTVVHGQPTAEIWSALIAIATAHPGGLSEITTVLTDERKTHQKCSSEPGCTVILQNIDHALKDLHDLL